MQIKLKRLLKILGLSTFLIVFIGSCNKDELIEYGMNQGEAVDNNLISGGGSSSFERLIGGIKLDVLYSGKQTSCGGYVFCGFTENQSASERDIILLKTNNQGETEWIKTFSDNYMDQGWHVEQTSDDGFIIVATSSLAAYSPMSSIPYDGQLLKINSTGTLQWKKSFNFGTFTSFVRVRQTYDGGFVILGSEYSSKIAILLKTDSNGDEQWRKTFNNKKEFYHIDLTSDGGFIICGTNQSNTVKQSDIYVVKTDSEGDTLWTRTFGDNYDNTPTTIMEVPKGFVICGYHTNTPSGASGFVTMIDSSGIETWTRDYNTNDIQALNFISLTNDDKIIVVGRESFGNASKGYIMKISSVNGDIFWQKSFNAGECNLLNEIHQTSDNGYIIAGYTLKSGNGNGYIIKTNANGN